MFHVVSSKEKFRRKLTFIGKYYDFISMEEVNESLQKENNKYRCCHLTFDDGDSSFFKNVFPILKENNIPASLYVSPKVLYNGTNYWFQEIENIVFQIGNKKLIQIICDFTQYKFSIIKSFSLYSILKTLTIFQIQTIIDHVFTQFNIVPIKNQNLTNTQLRIIAESNLVDIGPHTMNHPILSNETDEISRYEIEKSIYSLKPILGAFPKYFAYPNGDPNQDFGKREKSILIDNKISIAFSTEFKFYNNETDPLSVPRIGIVKRDNIPLIFLKIMLIRYWGLLRELFRFRKTEEIERKKLKLLN